MTRPRTIKHTRSYNHRRYRHPRLLILLITLLATVYWYWRVDTNTLPSVEPIPSPIATPLIKAGDVIDQVSTRTYTAAEATSLIRENYGPAAAAATTGVTKITFRYRSELPDGGPIAIYARAYLPTSEAKNLPTFAFATGTTGIGDQCAPSLENAHVANWANYDSHMAMYASQGFAAVTTDYEGMRDPMRIHHYMVGELEGRAVLDSIRALRRLPQAKDRISHDAVFAAGYSQGGHAAFWADKIASSYAPDVKLTGVIGFGPVMSVKQTLTDVTRAANINWFGPYVLYSYHDYYRADYGSLLLPRWQQNLSTDVPAHCIDTNLSYWGHTPINVYTPEFIQAMATDTIKDRYPQLARDLALNEASSITTTTPKRINQGELDNVVLPGQQRAIQPTLCQSSRGPVDIVFYPHATHYNTMVQSLADTLTWMRALASGQTVNGNCP